MSFVLVKHPNTLQPIPLPASTIIPVTTVGVQIWRHTIGSEEEDALVYHETDDQFYISIGLTRSKKFLYISAGGILPFDKQERSQVVVHIYKSLLLSVPMR